MDSYFDDSSMLRRVHREFAVRLSGPRALLMQAAHPVAFEGFFAHTGALDDPYGRLSRTAAVMNTIGFGTRAEADRATRRVRAMHRRVRGELQHPAGRFPAGTPFAADDPELLLWVLATLVDSALVFYDRYVGSLSEAERDAYWQDYRVIGGLFGLADDEMPADIGDFDAYVQDMLDGGDLFVTSAARELALEIVMRPPVALTKRPVLELVNFITVGLLPAGLRRQYGLTWDPLRALLLRGGAEYAKRVLVPLAPERMRFVSSARAGR
ncbi:MAG TPA: oxygenase MpaB family protein [Solirubrobacteraceae bacterium]|nr:oxygenase MpaB family protein [Solirubrobacteraceae bacterium]